MSKFSNSDVVFGSDAQCREGDSNPQGPLEAIDDGRGTASRSQALVQAREVKV